MAFPASRFSTAGGSKDVLRVSPAGPSRTAPTIRRRPASLYQKLETAVVPLYLDAPEKWARLMRTTLAYNGSYFNTNRMVKQYTRNAYYPVKLTEQVKVEEEALAK